MSKNFRIGDQSIHLDAIRWIDEQTLELVYDSKKYHYQINALQEDKFEIIDLEKVETHLSKRIENKGKQQTRLILDDHLISVEEVIGDLADEGETENIYKAPMVSQVVDVKVEKGQSVQKNDVLMVLEAMKLQIDIVAQVDGVVSEIHFEKGGKVQDGDILVELETEENE